MLNPLAIVPARCGLMLSDSAPVLFIGELSARDPVKLLNEPVPSNASESKSWSTGTQFRDHFLLAGR